MTLTEADKKWIIDTIPKCFDEAARESINELDLPYVKFICRYVDHRINIETARFRSINRNLGSLFPFQYVYYIPYIMYFLYYVCLMYIIINKNIWYTLFNIINIYLKNIEYILNKWYNKNGLNMYYCIYVLYIKYNNIT